MRSRSIVDRVSMGRIVASALVVVLAGLGQSAPTSAQDIDNGRRLAERWCAACHAIGEGPTKFNRAQPLSAIAARRDVNAEMLTAFLLLPHATMPNLALSRRDAADLAAFITDMKK